MAEASVPNRPNIHRPMAAKYLHSARIKPTETREGGSRRGAMIGDRFTPGASFSCWVSEVATSLRDHLNCGIAGTLMRGGGGGATLGALPTPLGWTDIFSNAPRVAAFGRAPPTSPALLPLLNVPFRPRLRLAQLKRRGGPGPLTKLKRLFTRG